MKVKASTPNDFDKYRNLIISKAEDLGIDNDYLFVTTLHRYDTQIAIMCELEAEMADMNKPTVEKEYVKGRKNIVVNPVITEYNKTVSAANKTAETLMKMVKPAEENVKERKKNNDPLVKIMAMSRDSDE